MIVKHKGDLLAVKEGIVVQGCNAQGKMGSGIAALFKEQYPAAFRAYRQQYERDGLRTGQVVFHQENDQLIIANAITQRDYGRNPNIVYVNYPAITQCFELVAKQARDSGISDVHFPLIGCGLANGEWDKVAPRIEAALGETIRAHLWLKD